jgi:hypothetical protein
MGSSTKNQYSKLFACIDGFGNKKPLIRVVSKGSESNGLRGFSREMDKGLVQRNRDADSGVRREAWRD